jgi:hypothetical protein
MLETTAQEEDTMRTSILVTLVLTVLVASSAAGTCSGSRAFLGMICCDGTEYDLPVCQGLSGSCMQGFNNYTCSPVCERVNAAGKCLAAPSAKVNAADSKELLSFLTSSEDNEPIHHGSCMDSHAFESWLDKKPSK